MAFVLSNKKQPLHDVPPRGALIRAVSTQGMQALYTHKLSVLYLPCIKSHRAVS